MSKTLDKFGKKNNIILNTYYTKNGVFGVYMVPKQYYLLKIDMLSFTFFNIDYLGCIVEDFE